MSFFGNRRQVDTSPVPSIEPVQPTKPALSAPPLGFDTVLGTNTVLEGTLQSNANVRLDGTFTGSLEINGNVLVGETAKIKADVNARNISIAGAVRGNVSGKKVQILRTGRVWGDIRASALTTEEGAFIDGKITMLGHESSRTENEIPADLEVAVAALDLPVAEIEPELSDAVSANVSDSNELPDEPSDEEHPSTTA